jgi:hypothetical protein
MQASNEAFPLLAFDEHFLQGGEQVLAGSPRSFQPRFPVKRYALAAEARET